MLGRARKQCTAVQVYLSPVGPDARTIMEAFPVNGSTAITPLRIGCWAPHSLLGMLAVEPFTGKASRMFLASGPTGDSYNCTDVHCVSALPNFCSSFDDQPS